MPHKASPALNYTGAHRAYQNHRGIGFEKKPILNDLDKQKARKAGELLFKAMNEHKNVNLDYQLSQAYKLVRELARNRLAMKNN